MNELNSLTNLSIIIGSLITKNTSYLPKSLISKQLGINNYFQSFSRDQEREADFYAVETLKKLNLSNTPLINFLVFLEKESKKNGIKEEFYKFSSHPLFAERYDIIKSEEINNTKYNLKTNKKFLFIRAKLFGYTSENLDFINQHLDGEYLMYANSIILSKEGKLKESFKKNS